MRASGIFLGLLSIMPGLVRVSFALPPEKLSDLQAKFDREADSVHKAKMLEKLGGAEFEAASAAEKAGDYATAGLTLEKYRDNVRAALDALKKEHPEGERHSNGYRQLEIQLRKGLREVDETLLIAPDPYKPPLELVRRDLTAAEDELLRKLFPRRPGEKPLPPHPEKQP